MHLGDIENRRRAFAFVPEEGVNPPEIPYERHLFIVHRTT